MKLFLGFSTFFILTFIAVCNTSAQGMCVIGQVKVGAINGFVSLLTVENRLKGALIKLSRKGSGEIVAETQTAGDGSFQFNGSYEGKYLVTASFERAATLYIPIKTTKKKNQNYLQITLGANFNESCGGGTVELKSKTGSATK